MKAEVYILGLFTFQGEEDENIVFSNEQLNIINTNIEHQLGIKRVNQPSKWVNYPLNQQELMMPSHICLYHHSSGNGILPSSCHFPVYS